MPMVSFNAKIRHMSKQVVQKSVKKSLPPGSRAFISLILPPVLALVIGGLLSQSMAGVDEGSFTAAIPLATLGVLSWFMGLAWYGLEEMGLRGKRPLFSGVGFAVLAWIPFLVLRFVLVSLNSEIPIGRGSLANQGFFYLLLFEAFAVQLWAYGLVFRSLADWRGALSAAFGSGIAFGMIAFLLFRESFLADVSTLLYFLLWGVLYGLIRLRTGSILGTVMVQAMHSFTAWIVFLPLPQPDPGQLRLLYLTAGVVYLVVLWRLWPKQEEDYRV